MTTIQVLKKLDKETPAKVYIVGGFVRDYLRNKSNNDLDIVIRNLSINKIQKFLSNYGKAKKFILAKTNDKFVVNVLLFKSYGDNLVEAQITLPRKGKNQKFHPQNTLEQDAKFRDFRINSLYVSINYESKKDVIDFNNGRNDINNRIICANGSSTERIKESPVRMLRAISLASRTNYTIAPKLWKAIKTNAGLIKKVPFEVIRIEFNKILMCKKPSKYLKFLQKTNLLKYIAPEIQNCVRVKQDKKYHKYDVFTHLIYTVDNSDFDLTIRLAGLLHDIGKPAVRQVIVNVNKSVRTTFYNHEIVSAKLATTFLKRLKYDNLIIKKVVGLVRLHMYHYTREWTDSALRRFIKKININKYYMNLEKIGSFPLFRLRAAERLGSGKKIAITDRQKDFEKRVIDVYNSSSGLNIVDLKIDGNIIMEIFKLKPGVQIGNILTYLLNNVLNKPALNNKLDLLKLTTEYLYSNSCLTTSQ
jgi:putative nucleotidyltransferase with HDIG domain